MSAVSSSSRLQSEAELTILPSDAKRPRTEESHQRTELDHAASKALDSCGLKLGAMMEVRWLCGEEGDDLKEVWWPARLLDRAARKIEVPDEEHSVELLVFAVEFQAKPELEEEASTYDVAFLSRHRLLLAAEGERSIQDVDEFEPAFWRIEGDTWLPDAAADAQDSEEDIEEDIEEEGAKSMCADIGGAVTAILEETLSSSVWQQRFQALGAEKQRSVAESVAVGRERLVAALEQQCKNSGSKVVTRSQVQAAIDAVQEELGVG